MKIPTYVWYFNYAGAWHIVLHTRQPPKSLFPVAQYWLIPQPYDTNMLDLEIPDNGPVYIWPLVNSERRL